METKEDILIRNIVKKGKRTKRPRTTTIHHSTQSYPVEETTASMSSSGDRDCLTPDDEEMVNCLILQSHGPTENPPIQSTYECRRCNKTFSSFQALGGHRASQKKLKISPPGTEEKNNSTTTNTFLNMTGPVTSLPTPAVSGTSIAGTSTSTASKKVNKIHECSICGAEFISGRALGGHMRRHRPLVVAPPESLVPEIVEEEKIVLEFDLNLPAPFEELESGELVNGRGEAFPFKMKNDTGSVGPPVKIIVLKVGIGVV